MTSPQSVSRALPKLVRLSRFGQADAPTSGQIWLNSRAARTQDSGVRRTKDNTQILRCHKFAGAHRNVSSKVPSFKVPTPNDPSRQANPFHAVGWTA
ncbi:hypothetical protein E4U09_006784 [Claviceps aff. purpurea]|uniref:Uncharacterized protein n=1 Tax=Claviceps aff. purpurea TaxID=1967640 RepID=A0A9P7QMR4_9HYPO|nr:hypothetical protein E4U09_006784 [Claviceps aff. purpurea]